MAWHLARLKLALIRGGLRRGGAGGWVAFTVTLCAAVMVGGTCALALTTMRSILPSTACDIGALTFALLAVFWALGPLLALASDATVDIDKLALFPLTARQLMPGLLLGATIGFGGLFTTIVLFGAFVGMAGSGASAIVAIAAVVLELVLCLALSRWVSTSLSAAASKRRWRDVALFLGPILALAINLAIQTANRAVFVVDGTRRLRTHSHALRITRTILRWLPTGWSTVSIQAARRGNYGLAVLGLAATAALAVALIALWWRAIQRATTTSATPGAAQRAAGTALTPRVLSWLPHNAFGAVVAKEMRYTWRDPRRRAALLGVMFAGALPLFVFRGLSTSSARTCLIAVWPALIIGLNAYAFGMDGDRLWVDVAAGVSVADELRARTLARLTATLPVIVVLLIGFSALAKTAAGVVPSIGAVAAAVGIGSGFAAVLSVRTPFPMGDATRGNAFGGGGTGENASAGFTALGAMLVSGLLVTPLVLLSLNLSLTSPWQSALAVAGISAGVLGWRFGLAAATTPRRPDAAALLTRLTRV
jgi:ABC-2 type transport system permease protein